VAHLDKSFTRPASNPLCRRIGRDQSGMLSLKLLQLPHEGIKLGVTDLRLVENVIKIFVVPNLLAESFDLFMEVFSSGGHRQRL
jgi:hypothetical protein